jgi:hypothetical protein
MLSYQPTLSKPIQEKFDKDNSCHAPGGTMMHENSQG